MLEPGDDRLLRNRKTTLSLALNGFTSEFGMGSGGTHLLKSPGKIRRSKIVLRSVLSSEGSPDITVILVWRSFSTKNVLQDDTKYINHIHRFKTMDPAN